MPMVTLHKVGEGNLYHLHVLDHHATDPGYGQGRPGGRPDQGLPGYGHPDQGLPGSGARPDQGLPGHGHPDQGLPGSGARPDQGLPGQGQGRPGIPGNELPDTPPPQLAPGWTLVLIRGGGGKWAYAAIAPGSPPPRPLPPGNPARPDQGLPGGGMPGQGHPDQGLPGAPVIGGGPAPPQPGGPRPDQGLPPTAAPKPA